MTVRYDLFREQAGRLEGTDLLGNQLISIFYPTISGTKSIDVQHWPNNSKGDNPSEPDFRDSSNASCSSGNTFYAITDVGMGDQYNPLTGQHETGLSTGLIRATVLCHRTAGWYR